MTLVIENLIKEYGKHTALNDVSLNVSTGMFGLLGPNGAGKTTLMRILTTLIPASSGKISFGDLTWDRPHAVRGLIGYLPQKFSLYKNIKVIEALDHIAVLKGIKKNRKEIVNSILERVNLTDQRDKKIGQLSGGMVRRVGIAQAVIGNPKIIIVDEPTAGLDPQERIRFRKLLRDLGQDSIVMISTHIVEDIEATCDRAAILYRGQLVAQGGVSSLGRLAQGKVWEMQVSLDDYYRYSESLEIISSQRVGDSYHVRLLSDIQPPDSVLVNPTLEDGYLYVMSGAV